MLTANDPCVEAYDAFAAALDPITRDAVTKLMIHTRTRPDDPHMVGVCLTAVATITNAEAQARVLAAQHNTMRALEDMKTDPRFTQGLERVSALTRALEAIRSLLNHGTGLIGIFAGVLALCWVLSVAFAWKTGYQWAERDLRGATHQRVCDALNGYVAGVSQYWRNSLGLPAAADRLANTYQPDCPR